MRNQGVFCVNIIILTQCVDFVEDLGLQTTLPFIFYVLFPVDFILSDYQLAFTNQRQLWHDFRVWSSKQIRIPLRWFVLNAIAGAYSENLPVICVVGGPNSNDYGTNQILHYTIGLPDFTQELQCFRTVTCAQIQQSIRTGSSSRRNSQVLDQFYEFQVQYGLISWSVGPTLGYAQAAKNKRVIMCTTFTKISNTKERGTVDDEFILQR
ncbi:hypothetical protein L1887_32337 [Cichorium endivia]|nr:hypothetical protein L1887_32337 [Cichorium endivia]